jgi:hypothetical protein
MRMGGGEVVEAVPVQEWTRAREPLHGPAQEGGLEPWGLPLE